MKLFDSAIGKTVTTKPKRYRALASRCGVFPYLINGKLIYQYRPEDEVFNQDSVDSLLDAAITIGHPDDDEELSESHGTVYNSEPINNNDDDSGIYADFLVFTEEARDLSSAGIPVSPMYDVVLVEKQGDFDGQTYDFIQTNIRYSSLGLVSKARQKTTKVYFQISKDSGMLLPDTQIIEIPEISYNDPDMKTKLAAPLTPVINSDNLDTKETTQETIEPTTDSTTETTVESTSEAITDSSDLPLETIDTQQTSVTDAESDSDEQNSKPPIAVFNTAGGINVNKDYLEDAIDVAQRAAEMGLLSFSEAMMYSLSSLDTLMRMILLKEGVELDRWEDACGAYKVYMKLRPLNSTQSTVTTNSDSLTRNQAKPLLPKINHPLHQKPAVTVEPLVLPKTFDDLE